MKYVLVICFFFAGLIISRAQQPCVIKSAYAFYQISHPGALLVDEQGNAKNQTSVNRFIYVEYCGALIPKIIAVQYHTISILHNQVYISEKEVTIGDKSQNSTTTIRAKKGNHLVRIDLQQTPGISMPEINCNNIRIEYQINGKICHYQVNTEAEYLSRPTY